MLEDHTVPRIGEIKCAELTVGQLNEANSDIVKPDGTQKALAVNTRSALVQICTVAVDHELLPYNMGRENRVLPYSPESPHSLTAEEIHSLRIAFGDSGTRWAVPRCRSSRFSTTCWQPAAGSEK
ncbi:hypothetical protein FEF26_04295 [Nesterenkonia salmonea]|uniref:Uncharacterized protein n=1 Tax=Nesterenkonia salmonea TaxID=1804987 RepID=A0A5R9BDE2_9MICC|nr:hypothetical protein [Nesterenkonia salmonea]TLP98624.1 hypothetical protein FEF26_04295 [Nesterenkonia salmonea]